MSKALLPMHSGAFKKAPWYATSFLLSTCMAAVTRCSWRPMDQATLTSMSLCVEPDPLSL
jgi:hypothetical protein